VASYDNVGSFALQLVDSTFASVDSADTAGDCTAAGRYVCGATVNVGRFVPDHFAVALNTPVFAPACGPFTYIGQAFNYATAPVITVTAQDFANNPTTLYNTIGSWWRITNVDITPASQGTRYSAAAGTLDVTGLPAVGADPVIVSAGLGTGTLTFSSGTGLFFTRSTPTAPASPYDADISLAINVIDADGVTLATNPARFGTATAGNGIAFSDGNVATTNDKQMRFGRLVIRNANGSQLVALPVQVEAQYWSGAPMNAFITNTQDSCTSIAAANEAMGNYTANLSGSPTCETAIGGGGTLSAGRRTLQLAAPGSGNGGSVDVTVNLAASASGSTCTAQGGAPGSATTANLPHLQGNWTGGAYDVNPTARAAFGLFRGAEEVVYVRENF
jgi:MSHA biogenesis protein MshQ